MRVFSLNLKWEDPLLTWIFSCRKRHFNSDLFNSEGRASSNLGIWATSPAGWKPIEDMEEGIFTLCLLSLASLHIHPLAGIKAYFFGIPV